MSAAASVVVQLAAPEVAGVGRTVAVVEELDTAVVEAAGSGILSAGSAGKLAAAELGSEVDSL
jgi:hypothetical protein